MTIEKAIDKMKCLKHKALQGAIIVHDTYSDDYDTLNDSAFIALNMAIASLEAWEKVKAEIEDMLETLSDGGDDWFTAEKLNDVLEIIDKHLQEVTE